ncbi:MAG: hypothetical protein J6W47_01315, partial [Bacteroidales bacterium]|nr:hypothetical protein [Bacteroidales bacterium]
VETDKYSFHFLLFLYGVIWSYLELTGLQPVVLTDVWFACKGLEKFPLTPVNSQYLPPKKRYRPLTPIY